MLLCAWRGCCSSCTAAGARGRAPSWFSICMTTEFICALEVCMRLTALRDRTTSLASILHVPVSPRLAASLMDLLTLSSSR